MSLATSFRHKQWWAQDTCEAVSDNNPMDSGILTKSYCALSQLSIVLVMGRSLDSSYATLRKASSRAFFNDTASTSLVWAVFYTGTQRMLMVKLQ